ncbi:MAG TPA: response regulator transcription factor [Symbiobacteriaceae bacterium]|nr:response regulator transcription factor [Symbiobacteriaceae bacterium]
MSIRVVLIDDTRMFRDGLRLVIDMEADMTVVGVAGDGAEGIAVVGREQPDVVLMDIRMPVMDGVEATRRIKAEWPRIHVVILTTYSDDEFIFEALKAGAVGYMVKDLPASELVQAIRAVRQGGALIPPAIAARLVAEYTRLAAGSAPQPSSSSVEEVNPRVADLTPRETEILKLLARGLSNKEIADRLFLSEGTVKNYLSSIFSKLHARDRAQAISLALRQGLVD